MKAPYRIAAGLAIVVFMMGVIVIGRLSPSVNQPNVPSTASVVPLPSSQATSSGASITGVSTTTTASTATTTSTSTPKKGAVKAVPPTPVVVDPSVEAREVSASGVRLKQAMVNIICISSDKSIPSTSGTGIIIDPRGIILTAAHVAQPFLLQDYLGTGKMQCIVRTGSPARRAYLAEPIYVSPSWISANPSTLSSKNPTGSGQADVALLGIKDTATSAPLPSSFPYIPISSEIPQSGENVAIASYGAQYLEGSEINTSLYPILVFGTIQNRYTFTQNVVDIFSIHGSAASQEGSSGGGVSNAASQLIGIITTSSIEGAIQDRSLNVVTMSHLQRTFLSDMGQGLSSYLASGSISSLVSSFHSKSLQLGELLKNHLGS
jgi:hypothetical protein